MDFAKQISAGAIAGVCEYVFCQPVDIVATRAMLRTSNTGGGVMKEMSTIWADGGLRGVYRGLGPQILAAIPATIGMYVGERQFAELLRSPSGELSDTAHFASGIASGISETTLVCPFEVVKVRLMSKDYLNRYRNTFHCFQEIAKQDGFASFYKGYSAMCARNMIFNSTFFFGVHVLQRDVLPKPASVSESLAQDCVSAMVMGYIASVPKMPFFIAKTRLQNQSPGSTHYTGALQTIKTVAVEEGVTALWKVCTVFILFVKRRVFLQLNF